MTDARAVLYLEAYEVRQRDPVIDTFNRASVANGRMNVWQRMNRGVELVYVDDAEGRPRGLTPKQAQVLYLALEMIDGVGMTMRDMAAHLKVAPSTVSRALTKLASWGLIAYVVGRGRWAGLVIFRRRKGDRMDHLREAAKARVRRWSEAAQRRISRLAVNVAPYFLGGSEGVTNYLNTGTRYKGATLTVQRSWGWDEIEDALR